MWGPYGMPPQQPIQWVPYPVGGNNNPTPSQDNKSEYVKFLKKELKAAKGGDKKKDDPKKGRTFSLGEMGFILTAGAPLIFLFETSLFLIAKKLVTVSFQ